jgi:hypothetical protein
MGHIIHQSSNLQVLYNDARLMALFQALDELHSAASDGELPAFTPLPETEIVGWLQDLVFTAQETIAEIESAHKPARQQPVLRLVK